jgi:hypothetical protein
MKIAVALLLAIASPLSADWLSLRDGNLLETKGAWKERGRAVVYTSTTGVLVSIRASEVDLPMSIELGKKLKTRGAFIDLGATADPTDPAESQTLTDERAASEQKQLQEFVTDPNAPRVSGTLSAQSNEAAERNLSAYLEGPNDATYRADVAGCADRYEGSLESACIMRAEISSEIRKEQAAKAAEDKEAD